MPSRGRYVLALLLCAVAAVLLLDLTHARLSVPFWYDGDALYYGAIVKAVGETGWWLDNPRLGMPFGQELHDFPMPDSLSFLLLRAMSWVVSNDVCRFNLFYLASFPLTTLTTLWVLSRLGVSYGPALLASLLYAFTPHRLAWGEYHLMYTPYWPAPLLLLVLLRLATGELALARARDLVSWRVLASLGVCVVIASTGGVYQPFFACVLLVSVGVYAAMRARRLRSLWLPLLLAGFTFAVLVLNLLPSLLYRWQHGATATARRAFFEAEMFALKITQLLLPIADHRVGAFAQTRTRYDLGFPGQASPPVSLGVLGSVGFLGLLAWLLYGRRRSDDGRTARLLDGLGVANVTLLLLATVGGFGAVFAFFVSPQIRGYDRVVVFLALFAFSALALAWDALRSRWAVSHRRAVVFALATLALGALGLLDQAPRRVCQDFDRTQRAHAQDQAFFARVEAALPPGAMVFQLPRHEFPEGESYEQLKGYLHTRALRWSFGAMRGRRADLWQRDVLAKAPGDVVDTLVLAGFAAIVFDRSFDSARERALEAAIVQQVGEVSLSSDDGRYACVSLARRAQAVNALTDVARRRTQALQPVLVEWGTAFVGAARSKLDWRACGASGEIVFDNWLSRARRVRLSMTLVAAQPSTVTLTSSFCVERVAVGRQPTTWTSEVDLPAGRARLSLASDAAPVALMADLPPMAFGVSELSVQLLDE